MGKILVVTKKIKKALREGGVSLLFKRLLNKIQWSFDSSKYTGSLTHQLGKTLPKTEIEFRPLQTSPNDVQIAERILLAFNKALMDENKVQTGDIWDRIQAQHGDFYAIYHDPVKVAEYMNNMNQHEITRGVSSSTIGAFQAMQKNPVIRQEWGALVKDSLVCFAEAVGVLRHNFYGDNLYEDERTILSHIEEKIGISLVPSHIEGGLYKMKINDKFFDHRDFWSAYMAWRVYKLVGSGASVAEIGGGIGKATLFAQQFGIHNYSIYDLPVINLVQAWYLIKSGVNVVLYGEKGSGVRILPYWEFKNGTFDLTLNARLLKWTNQSLLTI